jgi:3-oxoacyl-[acyl-carrier protein] reductase
MTQCMAIELAPRAKFLSTIPLGRMSTPSDVANACLWLAEVSSSFIGRTA